jgi:hypothetical protein
VEFVVMLMMTGRARALTAEHFGLPLLPASKAGGDFKKGANMAIIGATTMSFDFFNSIGLSDKIWNNGPLDTQIQWFRQLLPSVCGKGTIIETINSIPSN